MCFLVKKYLFFLLFHANNRVNLMAYLLLGNLLTCPIWGMPGEGKNRRGDETFHPITCIATFKTNHP
jgi:hypothetical protein